MIIRDRSAFVIWIGRRSRTVKHDDMLPTGLCQRDNEKVMIGSEENVYSFNFDPSLSAIEYLWLDLTVLVATNKSREF